MRFNGRNLMAIWSTRLHSLTEAGRGSGGRESISPGEGEEQGPIVFRVRYASRSGKFFPRALVVWKIFSEGPRGLGNFSQILVESLCGLGNFFRGASRFGKIILGQKILIVRARAPPHRRYATPQNFSHPQSCF